MPPDATHVWLDELMAAAVLPGLMNGLVQFVSQMLTLYPYP